MNKTMTTIVLAGAAALTAGLAACGSASPAPAGQVPAASQQTAPANPVTILRQAGAHYPASTRLGQTDVYGDRYAEGHMPGGDDVIVHTGPAAQLARLGDAKPSDDHAVITGPGFMLIDYGSLVPGGDSYRTVFRVSPLHIAHRVGGHLVPGSPVTVTPRRHAAPSPAAVAPAPAPAAAAPAAAAPAQQFTNAQAVVDQFYQDITDRNYAGAWALGGDNIGGTDYNAWVAGYDTTASITLSNWSEWGSGQVQTTLSAVQSDGSVRTYTGTYTVSGGVIASADITQTG
jgi:hypothetical protein